MGMSHRGIANVAMLIALACYVGKVVSAATVTTTALVLQPLWLDWYRPELVFGLLIALVLPEDAGSPILHRPDVDLR